MNHSILIENQKKRRDIPLWMLLCFSMFSFWQMGFIYYFLEPSSAIDGKIPLPINIDYGTTLTAVCYILGILTMIFVPKIIVWTQRIATGVALISAVAFFLPLPDDILRFNIYLQIFCCCLMIGFETFLVVNCFSEKSSIKYLTFGYGIAVFLIALIQNEVVAIPFSTFRFLMVGALVLLFIFFLCMPAGSEHLPQFVKKSDGLIAPKKMMWGAYLIAFIAALMGVGGPAVVGKVEHGVSIMYLVVALSSFTMYFLHKKANVHPFRMAPLFVGLGGFGFLVMLVSAYVPALSYVACILIGFGMTVCMLAPLYGVPIMKAYPSRYVASAIIGLAITAVLIHAVIAEMFLGAPIALYIFYAVIMAVLVFVFTQVEPFLMFALRRRISDDTVPVAEEDAKKAPILETEVKPEPVSVTAEIDASDDPLLKLSPKKREVAQLICLGYTNKDIATTLYLSEHTVKGYVKDIYITLDVHSRMELAVLVNNYRLSNKK
ncbi:MAG: helix-turn-helix transcriptional regulator [Ruminococcaceae bacterium]|nr:helix-turn-helix transcriptional regulator [Oscillospiraceae bacterium]